MKLLICDNNQKKILMGVRANDCQISQELWKQLKYWKFHVSDVILDVIL